MLLNLTNRPSLSFYVAESIGQVLSFLFLFLCTYTLLAISYKLHCTATWVTWPNHKPYLAYSSHFSSARTVDTNQNPASEPNYLYVQKAISWKRSLRVHQAISSMWLYHKPYLAYSGHFSCWALDMKIKSLTAAKKQLLPPLDIVAPNQIKLNQLLSNSPARLHDTWVMRRQSLRGHRSQSTAGHKVTTSEFQTEYVNIRLIWWAVFREFRG